MLDPLSMFYSEIHKSEHTRNGKIDIIVVNKKLL